MTVLLAALAVLIVALQWLEQTLLDRELRAKWGSL